MAYIDQTARTNRPGTLIAVAAIHVAAGFALVNGLAPDWLPRINQPVRATFIPDQKPVPEKPKETTKPKSQPLTNQIFIPPKPVDLTFNPVEITGTDKIELVPIDPFGGDPGPLVQASPTPLPGFTPKAARPRGNPGLWAVTNDYPASALRRDAEGVTGFRVIISTDGKVQACEVTRSSGHPDLDATTCAKIAQRGRFDAASDDKGQKVVGSYSSSIRWQLPKD